MIRRLECLSCEEKLRDLGLLVLEKVLGRLYCQLSVPEGSYRKDRDKFFNRACSNRTRGNGFKLKEDRFRLNIRKNYFTRRGVNTGRGCLERLETFMARLDRTLSNLEKQPTCIEDSMNFISVSYRARCRSLLHTVLVLLL